ncbi:unnamed protein product [Heligmosomoides polygyrus]|uniref:ShKT domain-containing protein n=1 Tax=Heligmosomoides polygyrus TaxID=6339 RepID=A0A3P8D883_HELPZ|nr:unnamed protein product [Heligmosomoides polygyrus]
MCSQPRRLLNDSIPPHLNSDTRFHDVDDTCSELGRPLRDTGDTSSDPSQHDVASACEDDPAVNCTKLKPQCLDHRYDDLMNEHCRKTCNRCDVVVGTTTVACFDASTECESWNKNGYCNNTFYPESEKKLYCAKTCALC